MPLPAANSQWPPPIMREITGKLAEWSAWYGGDPAALRSVYGQGNRPAFDRPSQYRGGVVGVAARTWWGRPLGDLTAPQPPAIHVPLASDICQASSDLLFAEPPTITVVQGAASTRTQEWLTGRLPAVHAALAAGADVGAGLGGTYLRVAWDQELDPEGPFLAGVDADSAVPEFRWGRLTAVTFWWELSNNGAKVRRRLERHELDSAGVGIIRHGLYEGTADNLGTLLPLAEDAATNGLVSLVGLGGADADTITTGSPGLAVVYIPNQQSRLWRNHPLGRYLGRSDFDSLESLLDALDMVYASLIRDIRIARGRIVVPASFLESMTPGQPGGGRTFDLDREVFAAIDSPPNASTGMLAQQFAIRVAEHVGTMQQITTDVLRGAGYSAQTFGEDETGSGPTATEVRSKERRSLMTRDRKSRAWKPQVAAILQKMVGVAEAVGFPAARGVDPGAAIAVAFADSIQESPVVLAQTAAALRAAEAASDYVIVATVHPDWDEPRITAEVSAIVAQRRASVVSSPDLLALPGADDPAALKDAFDALGVAVRAGVDPAEAAARLGLGALRFTGAVPTSLRLPAGDADNLEPAAG